MLKHHITPHWQPPPEAPALAAGEVHVWRASLESPPPAELCQLLNTAEWVRAGRYLEERDRERFIASRGILRTILGRYLQIAPREIRFHFGPNGKPELQGVCSTLQFNLSHSDNLLLVALTQARQIGVDIEQVRENVPFEMLTEHYFGAEQAWYLRLLPQELKAAHFYDLWTRTEARLKASGLGLAGLDNVIIPDRWSLCSLTAAEGFAAALAVEGAGFSLECWSWPN